MGHVRERRPSRAVPCLEARGVEGSPGQPALRNNLNPRVTSQHPGEYEATGSTIARGTLGTCLGSPEVLYASHAEDRIGVQAMGALGTRRSVRPLYEEGGRNAHTSGAQARRERDRMNSGIGLFDS